MQVSPGTFGWCLQICGSIGCSYAMWVHDNLGTRWYFNFSIVDTGSVMWRLW